MSSQLSSHLRLPLIAASMRRVSRLEQVVAAGYSGVIGAFFAADVCGPEQLVSWRAMLKGHLVVLLRQRVVKILAAGVGGFVILNVGVGGRIGWGSRWAFARAVCQINAMPCATGVLRLASCMHRKICSLQCVRWCKGLRMHRLQSSDLSRGRDAQRLA